MQTTMTRNLHPRAMGRRTGGLVAAIEADLIERHRPHEFMEVTLLPDSCGCLTRQRRHGGERGEAPAHDNMTSLVVVERCRGTRPGAQCMVEWRGE